MPRPTPPALSALLRARLVHAASLAGGCLVSACASPQPPAPASSSEAPATTQAAPAPSPSPSPTAAPATAPTPRPTAQPFTCSSDNGDCGCFPPRSQMHGEGLTAGPRQPFKHTYDDNGCAPMGEVTNSCCNAATAGPSFVDGKCCYRFKVGSCCGRPLLGHAGPLVAPLARGGSWAPGVVHLSAYAS